MPDGLKPILIVDGNLQYVSDDGVVLIIYKDMRYFIGHATRHAYGKLHPLELPRLSLSHYFSGRIVVIQSDTSRYRLNKNGWSYETVQINPA